MVSAFSLHQDAAEAARRGQEGFEFFRYAISALVTNDTVPGCSRLWDEFQEQRKSGALAATYEGTQGLASAFQASPGIGTPADFRKHVHAYEAAGVDQIILLQQAGRNTHADICASLELFAGDVLPEFKAKAQERERRKAEKLAPYIAKALARKKVMAPLAGADIPVVRPRWPSLQSISRRLSGHVASPLLSTTTSRSTARARKETRSPSGHISVRMVSPGKTGEEKRTCRLLSRAGSLPQQALTMARPATP
jgi:hypothetical protein